MPETPGIGFFDIPQIGEELNAPTDAVGLRLGVFCYRRLKCGQVHCSFRVCLRVGWLTL
jgi:hypothetical protein